MCTKALDRSMLKVLPIGILSTMLSLAALPSIISSLLLLLLLPRYLFKKMSTLQKRILEKLSPEKNLFQFWFYFLFFALYSSFGFFLISLVFNLKLHLDRADAAASAGGHNDSVLISCMHVMEWLGSFVG